MPDKPFMFEGIYYPAGEARGAFRWNYSGGWEALPPLKPEAPDPGWYSGGDADPLSRYKKLYGWNGSGWSGHFYSRCPADAEVPHLFGISASLSIRGSDEEALLQNSSLVAKKKRQSWPFCASLIGDGL